VITMPLGTVLASLSERMRQTASTAVVAGVPSNPLPVIHVRVRGGRIYAWGTHAPTWG